MFRMKCEYYAKCRSYETGRSLCEHYSWWCVTNKEFEKEEGKRLAERRKVARLNDLGWDAYMREIK